MAASLDVALIFRIWVVMALKCCHSTENETETFNRTEMSRYSILFHSEKVCGLCFFPPPGTSLTRFPNGAQTVMKQLCFIWV